MAKRHLIRSLVTPVENTACGIDPNYKKITLSPQDVTCSNCLRCMTTKEVRKFLGNMSAGITVPKRLVIKEDNLGLPYDEQQARDRSL